tara:strand:- start:162 stop:410 length:249 start_codon:yes stop_codon:yes gene_type:complete
MERERFGRDREREDSPSASFGQSGSERTQPMGSKSEGSRPTKPFLDKFISDKVSDFTSAYEKDENRPGGMAKLAYLAIKKQQ